jgi:outer membrane lipoprotein-sorting protein
MSSGLGDRRLLVALVVVALALAGSAVVTGAAGPAEQPSGEDVLDRVEQRYGTAETLTATANVTVENDTLSATATVEVAAASDNRSRVVVTSDGTTYRAGSNGTVVWAVGPNRSAAWPVEAVTDGDHGQFGPASGADALPDSYDDRLSAQGTPQLNWSNVSATVVGTPSVDGTSTYETALSHPEVNGSVTLWVDQTDYSVVRATATDGTNRTTVAVESTSFNVSVHDSTFDPPTDRVALSTVDQYDEFEAAQSATDLTLPALDGTFAAASVTTAQGETVAAQQYVRDAGNVSVVSTTADDWFDGATENASTTTVEGQSVATTTAEDRAIAAWTDDGVTTAVLVEGSTDRALDVAGELLA